MLCMYTDINSDIRHSIGQIWQPCAEPNPHEYQLTLQKKTNIARTELITGNKILGIKIYVSTATLIV